MALVIFPTTATATARDDPSAGRAETSQTFVTVATPGVLALAALALGAAVQVNYGQYHPLALAWVALAVACCGAVVLAMRKAPAARMLGERRVRPEVLVLATCVAAQFVMLGSRHPGVGELHDAANLLPFRAGLVAAAAFAALAAFGPARTRRVAVILLLGSHFALGLWLLRTTPQPAVDVCVFQRDACAALLEGRSPYGLTFPDVSPPGANFYGPNLSTDGRLHFGYPYPPLSLLLAVPGHALGDFRYSQLAAMTLAGGLIAASRPGRVATLAAAMLLFTPRGFFVLQAGWTEPFVVLMLTLCIFLALRLRSPFPAAVAFGLLLASKQYLILALPLVPLLLPQATSRERMRFVLFAAAAALLVTLPLALWDLEGFGHSAVLLQFRQPFREDALSFLVPLARARGTAPSSVIPFVLAAAAAGFCLWKCPRTPAGFAAGFALVFLVFFAFNKQAFCNYYHVVIAALCCAVAAAKDPSAYSASVR